MPFRLCFRATDILFHTQPTWQSRYAGRAVRLISVETALWNGHRDDAMIRLVVVGIEVALLVSLVLSVRNTRGAVGTESAGLNDRLALGAISFAAVRIPAITATPNGFTLWCLTLRVG
jgi:hypothetical protein